MLGERFFLKDRLKKHEYLLATQGRCLKASDSSPDIQSELNMQSLSSRKTQALPIAVLYPQVVF